MSLAGVPDELFAKAGENLFVIGRFGKVGQVLRILPAIVEFFERTGGTREMPLGGGHLLAIGRR